MQVVSSQCKDFHDRPPCVTAVNLQCGEPTAQQVEILCDILI